MDHFRAKDSAKDSAEASGFGRTQFLLVRSFTNQRINYHSILIRLFISEKTMGFKRT